MANRAVMVKDVDVLNESIIKQGFSYRKLAREVGCSQTQISLLIKGERNPSPETAVSICKALRKKFDELFFISFDCKSNQN